MEIIDLYIDHYKKFHKNNLVFSKSEYSDQELIKYFFPTINIQALIGKNGSGKTTTLSFICMIFRYLERQQDKIPCNFRITYRIKTDIVMIYKNKGSIFFVVNNSTPKLLLELNAKKKQYLRKPEQLLIENDNITMLEIIDYLPKCIVVSVDIDYPPNYSTNLIRNVNLYESIDISYFLDKGITGKDVSYGALCFVDNSLKNEFTLLKQLGIEFSGYVQLYYNDEMLISPSEPEFDKILNFILNDNLIEEGIKKVKLKELFDEFIEEISYNTPGIGFNIVKFLTKNKKLNYEDSYEILNVLIKYHIIYINDIYFKKMIIYTVSKI